MKEIRKFNLYDILKVETNLKIFPKIFEDGDIKSWDLEVLRGDFDFKHRGLKPYHRFPIYMYAEGKKIVVKYKPKKQLLGLKLENLEDETRLYFKESILYRPFHNVIFPAWPSIWNVVRFLLQIKFLQKGVVPIHAATISKEDNGIILPAWPGTGKSTTSYNLSKYGFDILGDEMALLDKFGKAYRLSDTGMFTDRRKKKLFWRKKKFDFNSKNIEKKIKTLVFLRKGEPGVEKNKLEDVINSIVASTNFEFQNFFTRYVFLAYCFSSNFDPNFVDMKTEKILRKSLKGVKCYTVYGDRSNFHETISDLL